MEEEMVRGSERRKDVGAMAERIARPQWSDDACAGTTCRRFDPITNKCVESAGDYYDLSSLKTQVTRHDQHNHSLSKAKVSTFAIIVTFAFIAQNKGFDLCIHCPEVSTFAPLHQFSISTGTSFLLCYSFNAT